MRVTVFVADGAAVQLKISPLATGLDLKRQLDAKRPHGKTPSTSSGFVGRHHSRSPWVLLFEGVPVDDRVSLRDAGVRPRSTLKLARVPAHMMRGDDGLPVY
jgi:hypothetical protein